MDIVVKDLNAMDQISIRTENSEYQFQVINPTQCRGYLSGGIFGKEQHEAILTGSLREQRERLSSKLETGTCALFHIAARERLKCLTTSVITHLALAQ
jgi:hypothetical protein